MSGGREIYLLCILNYNIYGIIYFFRFMLLIFLRIKLEKKFVFFGGILLIFIMIVYFMIDIVVIKVSFR